MKLTADQIETFRHEGYISLPRLTTDDEIAFMREIYDGLFSAKAGWNDGNMFDFASDERGGQVTLPQMLNLSQYAPQLKKTAFHKNALAIAKQLLGKNAELVFEHAIRKPELTGPATPWHQDEAFFPGDTDYESLTVWMPLQDATIENGCMRFVPGSHRGELLAHQSIGNDPKVHGLEAVGIDEMLALHAPVPTGGATIHHYRTLHAAGPNTSSQPRRAYALGFGVRGRRTPQAEFPWNMDKVTARSMRAATHVERKTLRQVAGRIKRRLKQLAGAA